MAKIKVLLPPIDQSGGIEAPSAESLMAVAANASGETPHSADVIRDNNGKIIRVDVNLPDSAAQAARDAIEAHSPKASVGVEPIVMAGPDEGFDSYTNGQNLLGEQLNGQVTISTQQPVVVVDVEASNEQSVSGANSLKVIGLDASSPFSNPSFDVKFLINDQLLSYDSASISFDFYLAEPEEASAKGREEFRLEFGPMGTAISGPAATQPPIGQSGSIAFTVGSSGLNADYWTRTLVYNAWMNLSATYDAQTGVGVFVLTTPTGSETITLNGPINAVTSRSAFECSLNRMTFGVTPSSLTGPNGMSYYIDNFNYSILHTLAV